VHGTEILPEFECQGQRSRSRTKNAHSAADTLWVCTNGMHLHGCRGGVVQLCRLPVLRRWENHSMLSSVSLCFYLVIRKQKKCGKIYASVSLCDTKFITASPCKDISK